MGLTRYMSVLMDDAMKQARFFDHEFVMPEHMLLALLRQYAFCQALQEEGVDSLKMHEDLVGWLAKQERVPETIKYLPEPSSLFKTMFGTACALAAAADRQLVNVPHFVQAMFGANQLPAHVPQLVAAVSLAARVGAPLPPRGPPSPTLA